MKVQFQGFNEAPNCTFIAQLHFSLKTSSSGDNKRASSPMDVPPGRLKNYNLPIGLPINKTPIGY
jgi:hypothetical protein